jgi:hypothetical protein
VGRALPHLLALILGVAAALAIGCGDRSNLIPADAASQIKAQLNAAQSAIDSGDCATAQRAVAAAKARAEALGPPVDKRLRSRINEGIRALEKAAPKDCAAARAQTQTTTTDTTPTDTTPTDTTPTVTIPPETTTTETTPPATTPTETTPPATTPQTTPSTTPDGGTSGGVPVP